MTPDQQAFEAAAYIHYQQRHAAGKTSDSHEPIGTPENFFWKEADGTYGVLMNNAAWWGWQAAKVDIGIPISDVAPECKKECLQAVDYGVWPEHRCSPTCVRLERKPC